jgi:hypothetical protein
LSSRPNGDLVTGGEVLDEVDEPLAARGQGHGRHAQKRFEAGPERIDDSSCRA